MNGKVSSNTRRVIVADSNPHLGAALQRTLVSRGIRGVVACSDAKTLTTLLDQSFIDLLICDSELPGGSVPDIVRRIRLRTLGRNPFAVVVAVARDPESASSRSIIDAGVDEVIHRPIAARRFFRTMRSLIVERKPFVICPDFIGPTRRATVRPGETSTTLVDTPNTLRRRMLDPRSDDEIEQAIEGESTRLDRFQLDATIKEIDRLVTRVADHYNDGGTDGEWRGDLNRLVQLSEQLNARHSGTEWQVIADLASLQGTLSKRILAGSVARKVVDVDLMIHLNQAVQRAFAVEENATTTMKQIADTIIRFTQR